MDATIKALKSANHILIFCHVSPDGDTLGSASALFCTLKSMNKKACIALDGGLPKKYSFLGRYASFCSSDDIAPGKYDLFVAVDVADLRRIGALSDVFKAHANTINIDHHKTNTRFAAINYVKDRPATAEIMYEILIKLGAKLNKEIGECLYTALCTDTGRFSYLGTDEKSFLLAAEIAKAGADIPTICTLIYASRSFESTKLLERALDSIRLYSKERIAVMTVTQDDLKLTGALPEDCEELIDYARQIMGVEIAVMIRETDDHKYKVSMRSKYYADVSAIASKYGGGGHIRAAGYMSEGELNAITQEIVSVSESSLK